MGGVVVFFGVLCGLGVFFLCFFGYVLIMIVLVLGLGIGVSLGVRFWVGLCLRVCEVCWLSLGLRLGRSWSASL